MGILARAAQKEISGIPYSLATSFAPDIFREE